MTALMSQHARSGSLGGGLRVSGQIEPRNIREATKMELAENIKFARGEEKADLLLKEHTEAKALKEDRRHDLKWQIERVDAEIDVLVYELYELTEEEIAVVQGR